MQNRRSTPYEAEAIKRQTDAEGVRRILLVDDSKAQRVLLRRMLEGMGHVVFEAVSGKDALEVADEIEPDLVISDWMMPGMDGVEFCRAFRALDREFYGYFILLTSKAERRDVQVGFEAGADDFLTKPVDWAELGARLNAGDRIIRMQRDLATKNKLLVGTLEELQTLYAALDRDLDEARKLQQALVPKRHYLSEQGAISLMLRSAGHVGGDLVGVHRLGASRYGLFAIDVSGHGIAAALMTARIAGYLSGQSPEINILLGRTEDGLIELRDPALVCRQFNEMLLADLDTEIYFTATILDCNLITGCLRVAQAGHPPVLLQSADGSVRFLGDGGMPIGLIENATYETVEYHINPGERLLVFSDGVTECPGASKGQLDEVGLERIVLKNAGLAGQDFLEALMWDLFEFSGTTSLPDDLSGILIERAEISGQPDR